MTFLRGIFAWELGYKLCLHVQKKEIYINASEVLLVLRSGRLSRHHPRSNTVALSKGHAPVLGMPFRSRFSFQGSTVAQLRVGCGVGVRRRDAQASAAQNATTCRSTFSHSIEGVSRGPVRTKLCRSRHSATLMRLRGYSVAKTLFSMRKLAEAAIQAAAPDSPPIRLCESAFVCVCLPRTCRGLF